MITFRWYSAVGQLRSADLMFDAAGVTLFAVSGTQKAALARAAVV
jgi:uncharacterized membrane protein YeiH